MKTQRRWIVIMFALALSATGAVVFAQDKAQEKGQKVERDMIIERHGGFAEFGGPGGNLRMPAVAMGDGATSVFVSSEMGFGGKVVKGAPYSAQAVTESVQMLADGNRIARKTSASVYRDSEGRTRRDLPLGNIGPYAVAGDPPQTVFINDPVAGVNYILDPRSRSARKLSAMRMDAIKGKVDASANGVQIFSPGSPEDHHLMVAEMKVVEEAAAASAGAKAGAQGGKSEVWVGGPGHAATWTKKEPKTESLGKQVIEGVEAEGTRTTLTIAAGEIGNDLPIQIVSERWYSPELQQVVMSKQSDPRFGETTYRLTNINRAEPSHALFEVPSDYTVKENLRPDVQFRIDRELERSKKKNNDN
jgi:hypothetical protein